MNLAPSFKKRGGTLSKPVALLELRDSFLSYWLGHERYIRTICVTVISFHMIEPIFATSSW